MELAYINISDDNSEIEKAALNDLIKHLINKNIFAIASSKPYTEIPELQQAPFLHFSNPFIRMWNGVEWLEQKILSIYANASFKHVCDANGEVVSVNPLAAINDYFFKMNTAIYHIAEHAFKVNLSQKKERALMTLIQDGTPYFDLWLDYYRNYFKAEDIYIICCQGSSAFAETLNPWLKKIKSEVSIYNMLEKLALLNKCHADLLQRYKVVVYADIDELIFHQSGLDSVLDNLPTDITRSEGYEIIHVRDREKPLDLSKSIISQRNYWMRNPLYDKPTIVKKPTTWTLGLHELECPKNINWRSLCQAYPGLTLFHLRNADYDIAHKLNCKNKQNSEVLIGGGEHCLYTDHELSRWWAKFERLTTPIPEAVKNSVNF